MAKITLNFNGRDHECTPHNTSVFVFPAEFASHNHVFCSFEAGNGEGSYVFGRPDILDTISRSGDYPIIYLPYVPDNDIRAYELWAEQKRQSRIITEEEIARFHEEAENDGVVGHWDELEPGQG